VALGIPYRGREVHQGTVVYVACEGVKGLTQRAEAIRLTWLAEDQRDPPMHMLPTQLDLITDAEELILDIRDQSGDPACIVLDTLNRSIVGSESKDEDMGAYIRAADQVRTAFPHCTVILIHHCGHNDSRPRGHSSLGAAADAQIAVKQRDSSAPVITEVEWMKDGPVGATTTSKLKVVEVGLDDSGKMMTSCVIEPTDASAAARPKPRKLSATQQRALTLLCDAINTAGEVPPSNNHIPARTPCVNEDLWKQYCYRGGISGGDTQQARHKAFKSASEALLAAGLVGAWDGWVWHCQQPPDDAPPPPKDGSPARRDKHDVLDQIYTAIDRGLPPNRDGIVRYYSAEATSERAAWRVLKAHRPELSDSEAQHLIKTWNKDGIFVPVEDGVRINPLTKRLRGMDE
jgi:AAA domain